MDLSVIAVIALLSLCHLVVLVWFLIQFDRRHPDEPELVAKLAQRLLASKGDARFGRALTALFRR